MKTNDILHSHIDGHCMFSQGYNHINWACNTPLNHKLRVDFKSVFILKNGQDLRSTADPTCNVCKTTD